MKEGELSAVSYQHSAFSIQPEGKCVLWRGLSDEFVPIPEGFQPIAGGRAERKPPEIVKLEITYPEGIPADPV